MRHVVDGPGGTRYVVAAEPDPGPSSPSRSAAAAVPDSSEAPNLGLLLSGADMLADGPWRVRVEGHADTVFSVPSGDVAQRLVLLLGEELETGVWAPDVGPTPPAAA